MTKKNISRILLAILIVSNIYLVWRINSNTMLILSYDPGFSQRSGLGKFGKFWAENLGSSKSLISYEDKERAESDSQTATNVLIVMDIILVGAIYFLNRKPKPKPVVDEEDDWRSPRRSRRRR